jgi:hypothetical protein
MRLPKWRGISSFLRTHRKRDVQPFIPLLWPQVPVQLQSMEEAEGARYTAKISVTHSDSLGKEGMKILMAYVDTGHKIGPYGDITLHGCLRYDSVTQHLPNLVRQIQPLDQGPIELRLPCGTLQAHQWISLNCLPCEQGAAVTIPQHRFILNLLVVDIRDDGFADILLGTAADREFGLLTGGNWPHSHFSLAATIPAPLKQVKGTYIFPSPNSLC